MVLVDFACLEWLARWRIRFVRGGSQAFQKVKTVNLDLGRHILAAPISIIFVIGSGVFARYDRAPPFEYITTEITPDRPEPGQEIYVRRRVIWHRICEGEAWTEIVGADRIVVIYDRGTRYPSQLGEQVSDRAIMLPKAMTEGPAVYRGIIRFKDCGLSSGLWPLEVRYMSVTFDVVAPKPVPVIPPSQPQGPVPVQKKEAPRKKTGALSRQD